MAKRSSSSVLELCPAAIASRFAQKRQQIRDCLNLVVLEPHMRERLMLTTDDRGYLRSNETHKRVDHVLDLVDKRSLYLKFLESVQSETTLWGHGYVKALLQGTYTVKIEV